MNIPTPETAFRYEAGKYTGGFSTYENLRDRAVELTRHLTVARETLALALHVRGTSDDNERVRSRMAHALTFTDPKQ